ncbi:hypothetical protein LCGC14_1826400 [marine sediment metagenome]|uniref:Uncharacterized protein n=1 Tax=marine sediment metagenome TaxID=412755 RepID=A0A0F9GHE6_9ZZZZ
MIKEFNKDGRQIDETVDDATSFMDDWQKKGGKIDGIYIVIDCHDMLQAFSSRMRLDTENDGESLDYAEVVAKNLIESFKVARANGIYEDRIMRRVRNFIDKAPVVSDCGGCGLQIVISPDGKIGVCQAFCGERES